LVRNLSFNEFNKISTINELNKLSAAKFDYKKWFYGPQTSANNHTKIRVKMSPLDDKVLSNAQTPKDFYKNGFFR